ncbi:MAG: hypothetical protein GU346_06445 [Thermocrinis sp.]|nr:hypothetical protein [Thermocrinis sp.]
MIAMDDRELIKRIMEEVKDEKLREELLALVVEKNKKKEDTKQEEKPIDYVARQEILFGATEGVAKVYWWISYIISIVLTFVGFSAGLLALLALLAGELNTFINSLFVSIFTLPIGLGGVFSLRSGKKEYEKLKRKSAN